MSCSIVAFIWFLCTEGEIWESSVQMITISTPGSVSVLKILNFGPQFFYGISFVLCCWEIIFYLNASSLSHHPLMWFLIILNISVGRLPPEWESNERHRGCWETCLCRLHGLQLYLDLTFEGSLRSSTQWRIGPRSHGGCAGLQTSRQWNAQKSRTYWRINYSSAGSCRLREWRIEICLEDAEWLVWSSRY